MNSALPLRPSKIGTSGWQYPAFRGRFYPPEVASAGMLGYYSERLGAIEINSTFYHFSRPSTYAKWAATTAPGFRVAVKANRNFTHHHPLSDPEGRLPEMFDAISSLGEKQGPVLFQLPGSLEPDLSQLRAFCDCFRKLAFVLLSSFGIEVGMFPPFTAFWKSMASLFAFTTSERVARPSRLRLISHTCVCMGR